LIDSAAGQGGRAAKMRQQSVRKERQEPIGETPRRNGNIFGDGADPTVDGANEGSRDSILLFMRRES
jgi:hypothetical protein